MHLNDSLAQGKDIGVLSTAESAGNVNAAIYAKRHIMAEGTIAFIRRDRLTCHNREESPYAASLFKAAVSGDRGLCLFLKRLKRMQMQS